ncbi:hypothetical protein ABVT39_014708 [Epinephelus coioides]
MLDEQTVETIWMRRRTAEVVFVGKQQDGGEIKGMFGRVSEQDLLLTCPLPYQRNRTPMEYEAACSAYFNPRSAPFTSHHCPSALLALQHSVTQQPRAKVPLSDLGHETDPLDENTRTGQLPGGKPAIANYPQSSAIHYFMQILNFDSRWRCCSLELNII